jgi:hypothetical protein
MFFHERVAHPQAFCFLCATARGLTRMCDVGFWAGMRDAASTRARWWRWTLHLTVAMQIYSAHARGARVKTGAIRDAWDVERLPTGPA